MYCFLGGILDTEDCEGQSCEDNGVGWEVSHSGRIYGEKRTEWDSHDSKRSEVRERED